MSTKDIITDECREAYNSLVEKPTKSKRFNYELDNLNCSLQLSASMSALHGSGNKLTSADLEHASWTNVVGTEKLTSDTPLSSQLPNAHTSELKVPTQPAPRPNTLPTRGSFSNRELTDPDGVNPLHILRDKNYRIIRPRMKVNSLGVMDSMNVDGSLLLNESNLNPDEACESPSYLTNTQYTFSERDVNIHQSDTKKFIGNKEIENLNPIPLPPRDRNKVLLTNVKRHVRKHPLIIPASGLQRTLNKVTTPVEEKDPIIGFADAMNHDEIDGSSKLAANSNKINYNMPRTSTKPAESIKLKQYSSSWRKFIENNFTEGECRTYENLDALRMQVDNTDSASLHFESILENDINQIPDTNSNDGNGHEFLFDLQHKDYDVPRINANSEPCASYENTDIRSSFFEREKVDFVQKNTKLPQPKNELADNALFNKFRESADNASKSDDNAGHGSNQPLNGETTDNNDNNNQSLEGQLKDSNSVSCEDLLEFADKKPKGKERGIESDEVRIMTKVLGTVATPDQCIIALDFIEWNVHRAIKIISLQNALKPKRTITFEECVEALQKYDWDLHTASIKLNMH